MRRETARFRLLNLVVRVRLLDGVNADGDTIITGIKLASGPVRCSPHAVSAGSVLEGEGIGVLVDIAVSSTTDVIAGVEGDEEGADGKKKLDMSLK